MSSPSPPSPAPSQAHSPPPPPFQPSPPSPGKAHVTRGGELTPTQPKSFDEHQRTTHKEQQQHHHDEPNQFEWQRHPHRPQLSQLMQPDPSGSQASSPLARPNKLPHLTQGKEPNWPHASPTSANGSSMFAGQQSPWPHQLYHAQPPLSTPSHKALAYPALFANQLQARTNPPSARPSQISPVQSCPAQYGWPGSGLQQADRISYSPYAGFSPHFDHSRPGQAYQASDTRAVAVAETTRSSYPPAQGLSQAEVASGPKRQPSQSRLEGQPSHPSFTQVNPPGEGQVPAPSAASPTKKAKVDKVERPPSYYSVPLLGGVTPFIQKLKFMVDNPHEFAAAVAWE